MEELEARRLLSVTLGTNFAGLQFGDTAGYIPPDTIAAAGPNHVVEAVNLDLRIFNKSGGTVSTQSLNTFFSSLAPQSLSDPVVMFDESVANSSGPAGRFIVGAIDYKVGSTSNFDFAVSNDADPTHGFTEMHKLSMTEGAGFFADYPRFGANADGYVFTFNQFANNGNGAYDHVHVLTVGKSSVTDQSNGTFASFQTNPSGTGATGQQDFTMIPAVMHGATTAGLMWFVDTNLTEGAIAGGNQVQVIKATNLLSNSPTFTTYNINVNSYGLPPAAPQSGGGTIETNDARILNAEWRGDRLVAAQTVGTGGVAHARFYEFNTSAAPTLTQQGEIAPGSGVYTYCPSIAIAGNGDLGMTFMQSSSSQFMSAYVTGQSAGTLGSMQTPAVLKAGEKTYTVFGEASPHRAGDFSGISVDPANPNTFWAANEYASSSGLANWGTWVGQFSLSTPAPAAPIISSLSDSPDPVAPGGTLTLTANGVSDPNGNNTITQVAFYRDGGNGVFGGDDTLVGTATAGTWSVNVPIASGFATGTYTYFAQATDNTNLTSNVVSTTNTVAPTPAPPTISSLMDSPDPVRRGGTLTLTANGVGDTAVSVSFYRDNGDGTFNSSDQLLGTDTSSSGGWSQSVKISQGAKTATYTYFAQAKDNLGQVGNVVSTTNSVQRTVIGLGQLPDNLRRAEVPELVVFSNQPIRDKGSSDQELSGEAADQAFFALLAEA